MGLWGENWENFLFSELLNFVQKKNSIKMVRGETLTVVQLKAQAKSKGIKGYSTMKKAELIKVLGGSNSPKNKPKTKKVTKKSSSSRTPEKRTKPSSPKSPVPKPISFRWQILLLDGALDFGSHSGDLGFIDFQKDTSSYLENRWKAYEEDAKEMSFDLPLSHKTSGGKINFKKMTLKWIMKSPVGEIIVVNRIRRKLN